MEAASIVLPGLVKITTEGKPCVLCVHSLHISAELFSKTQGIAALSSASLQMTYGSATRSVRTISACHDAHTE